MVETVSQNALRIRDYTRDEGSLEVEAFLDAVLSISDHVDPFPRKERSDQSKKIEALRQDDFGDLFAVDPGATSVAKGRKLRGDSARKRVPAEPEKDLLRFIVEHGEHLEDWQRDIVSIVREESLYFVPQMQTNRYIGTTNYDEVSRSLRYVREEIVHENKRRSAFDQLKC